MVKAKNSTVSLKTVRLIIGIVLGFIALGGMFFASKADIRDTVDTVVTKEIKNDNEKDEAKFFPKEDGTRLQEQVEYNGEKIDQANDKIKDIDTKMDQQYRLLIQISAKLDNNKDSI